MLSADDHPLTRLKAILLSSTPEVAARVRHSAGTIPDWWRKMSEKQRRAYLVAHPGSRFKTAQVAGVMQNLKPAQKQGLKQFLTKATGPDGTLTRKARARVQPENVKPKDVAEIADNIRAAQGDPEALKRVGSSPESKDDEAPKGPNGRPAGRKPEDHGYRAAALTMASVGLLVVGGASLVALGVPIGVFTPDLVAEAWRMVRPSKDDDVLVARMCGAIRKRMEAGHKPEELEDSLVTTDQPKQGTAR